MNPWQTFLIVFGLVNLCLFIFRKPLSNLILGFFTVGRKLCSPDEAETQAAKLGFGGFFSDPKLLRPTRDDAIWLLKWTGLINFVGSIVFYILIGSGTFTKNEAEQGADDQLPARAESKAE
jgi:hypothetical protein